MAVTRAQFEAGMTYQAFKDQMTRNREQMEENERQVPLSSQEVQALQRLPGSLHVLAIAEDWCADVVANLPVLARLAEGSGKLDVRILLRDQSPGSEVMDQYLNQGQYRSIPVFVFLDDDFAERGVFIERPDAVTRLRANKTQEIYRKHPDFGSPDQPVSDLPEGTRTRLQAEIRTMRQETNRFYLEESARSISQIALSAFSAAGGNATS